MKSDPLSRGSNGFTEVWICNKGTRSSAKMFNACLIDGDVCVNVYLDGRICIPQSSVMTIDEIRGHFVPVADSSFSSHVARGQAEPSLSCGASSRSLPVDLYEPNVSDPKVIDESVVSDSSA